MDGSSPAISTRSLTKQYGSTTAVDGLSFEVPSGVVYGFLGPNGAGKTTTMRMLTGLVEPTDGDGFVAGTHCSERRHLVDRIGLLPEKPPLYDELTGREQLQFAADLRNIPWERIFDRALGLADRLDLDDDLDRRIDGYSKGMRQKTAFVQAVQHDPAVVFLDEPTSGLDPRAARTLRELIVELADDGTTVFLSTHILPVVEEIADQVGVLYDGRLVSEGSPAELTDGVGNDGDADLEEAFLKVTDDPATAW
ncbi:ABC transporter ATP-binding protein [Halapricum desulfuricans]|uniref:ABC-type multidrug transport system, ATPase component n=1 Tax=Halapricum desulfuricans TaxID=2841257 RepID=A0A897NDE5_9EURY|nr:ABC transporter ATP-binding protein [Halapricum desulfuricans]QSG08979.1 ABC-type multidrug transport system, ATPase component [Halapricum desulfuricans]